MRRAPYPIPIGSMGPVYLPTFTIQINYINVGKYTVRPMDPIGLDQSIWHMKTCKNWVISRK